MKNKDKKKIIKELNKYRRRDLESYEKSGVTIAVEILAAKDSCDECKSWEGKRVPLKKALRKPPLPIRNCHNETYGYCRCTYVAVLDKGKE